MKKIVSIISAGVAAMIFAVSAYAQVYPTGLVDKSVVVVGNEMITLSELENEIRYMRANGMMLSSDKNLRCSVLEQNLEARLFLMQARIDSLSINDEYVDAMVKGRVDQIRQALGGDDRVEEYFGKPMYKLRREWKQMMEDQSLIQQMQSEIAGNIPELTPADVKRYLASLDTADVPEVPVKYRFSQICIYPDREAAKLQVREKLLSLRERILNGEKFSTLARIYSEDPGSAMRGGELGMTPKDNFWPVFADAAMALKPGMISQVVETPDGFHIIEVIEKEGDMFNARHILIKPKYTADDREKAFRVLDSLRTEINNKAVTFELAAQFYSEDPSTGTNGGQMADPNTGSSYFEIDQIYPPQDYNAIKNLKEGEITEPFESLDREGRNGNTVYKIIRVDKMIPAHRASFEDDYSLLVESARNKRAMESIDKFLDEKIGDTHIVIDPIFYDCDFSREAWNKLMSREKAAAENTNDD